MAQKGYGDLWIYRFPSSQSHGEDSVVQAKLAGGEAKKLRMSFQSS